MNQKVFVLSSVFVLSILIACKYAINIDLSLQKMITLAKSNKDVMVYDSGVQIKFQMASTKKCESEKENLAAILTRYYKEVRESKCATEGTGVFLVTEALISIKKQGTVLKDKDKSMVGIDIDSSSDKADVYLTMDKVMFESLYMDIKKKYMQKTQLANIDLSIRLVNDTKQNINFKVFNSFVNKTPYPAFGTFSAKPDDTFEIVISDVLKQYINDTGFRRIMIIDLPSGELSPQKDEVKKEESGNTGDETGSKKVEEKETKKEELPPAIEDKKDEPKKEEPKKEEPKKEESKNKKEKDNYSDDDGIIIN
ncbi:MAG: hypothetical protein H7A25_22565 [Leptospiraceae bacterium]|nr:hypothetical protein [Leptospiraceae bacterium]MCP5502699.1 hypothetical protein [Leptospiraceae bacterium]